ncbi:MAG: hypothetical protein U0232_25000 [Thermomicrobiales bacterium]
MAGEVRYPAVPVVGAGGAASAEVMLDARTGATTAVIAGRPFASRPQAGRRRSLDTSFLELRKVLRRGGYRLQSCGTCQHFRYSASSRDMSAGLSGYCGLGHREPGLASIGPAGPAGATAPVVTLYFGCPDWDGRDERALAEFFAREKE